MNQEFLKSSAGPSKDNNRKEPVDELMHSLFNITILIKAFSGVLEIIIGVLFIFFKTASIAKLITLILNINLVKHSGHFVTNYLTVQADHFSLSTKYFIAFYFLFYGIINIFLVIFLQKQKLWAYPVAISFFSFFIFYQFYRSFLHHSGLLFFLTIFDIFLLILTWLEYKRVKNNLLKI